MRLGAVVQKLSPMSPLGKPLGKPEQVFFFKQGGPEGPQMARGPNRPVFFSKNRSEWDSESPYGALDGGNR